MAPVCGSGINASVLQGSGRFPSVRRTPVLQLDLLGTGDPPGGVMRPPFPELFVKGHETVDKGANQGMCPLNFNPQVPILLASFLPSSTLLQSQLSQLPSFGL